jgi:hypothetical protein
MTSAINTNGINVNYPVPGVNNSSQGFRDNFSAIKNNLNTAAAEITDLENKVVLKAALDGMPINNDMANTLISNALTRSFRASTYNLGNAISGTMIVNVALGDVQYGTVAGNTTVQFTGWSQSGTQSNVQLELNVSNTEAVITFPSEVKLSGSYGAELLENVSNVGGTATVTVPAGVSQLEYRFSTIDCGNSITVEPFNRPQKISQYQLRSPSPKGLQGDMVGTTCIDTGATQLTVTNTYANDEILTTSTSSLYVDMPVVFTGTAIGGITAGTTYYVAAIPSATNFTVATSAGGSNVNLSSASGTMYVNPVQYLYIATQDYDSVATQITVTNTTATTNIVTVSDTTSLNLNDPIIFSGTTFGGIAANLVYYVKTIPSGTTLTISRTRTNGVADSTVVLSTASGSCYANSYEGSDIWKRIALNSW